MNLFSSKAITFSYKIITVETLYEKGAHASQPYVAVGRTRVSNSFKATSMSPLMRQYRSLNKKWMTYFNLLTAALKLPEGVNSIPK